MKSKPSIYFLVGVALAVLLIVGAALLWFTSQRRVQAVARQLETRRLELGKIYQRDPFPSTNNVQRAHANTALLAQWYDTLITRAGQGQLDIEARSPSTFRSVLDQTKGELLRQAKDKGTALPEDFGFGFERYFGKDSKLPAPESVTRLTEQLMIVQNLCQALFQGNISRLTSIQREVFESTDISGEGAAGGLSNTNAGVIADGALYGKYHFVVACEGRESAILGILNRLARHDMFFVVTDVEFKKVGDDVIQVTAAMRSPPATDAKASPASAQIPRRAERIVSGAAKENPMQVNLELDVYHFREAGAGE